MLAVALALAAPEGAQPSPPRPGWRPATAHLALFTPPRHRAAYAAYVSAAPLDRALAAILAATPTLRVPGSWEPRQVAATDAFGSGGPYNRWQLVRLYGSRGPRVARGAVVGGGQPAESWTLVSPYPDPDLRRLEPGTLLLILRVP
jgi:hypothetical protein